jgi:hypothetical protein
MPKVVKLREEPEPALKPEARVTNDFKVNEMVKVGSRLQHRFRRGFMIEYTVKHIVPNQLTRPRYWRGKPDVHLTDELVLSSPVGPYRVSAKRVDDCGRWYLVLEDGEN